MAGEHTVEKIGGTSMSRFEEVMKTVIVGDRKGKDLYNRIFIVSAYGGITNMLLEDKKTGAPGVYGEFVDGGDWKAAFECMRRRMLEINEGLAGIGLDKETANEFINQRLNEVSTCIEDLQRLDSYGHFKPDDYLPVTREILASLGEVHSAYNSADILKNHGVAARFVDLSGWKERGMHSFEEMIENHFNGINLECELPIVTGYVKCEDGIMKRFDRGYSEITFSKVAVVTGAREGIIHKEYHLSTGDPAIIGVDKVRTIGRLNFDIADQLSDLDMEAIHSKASKEMEMCHIPIRVKNAFESDDEGTLIDLDYVSEVPRVDIVCGRDDIIACEVKDPEMVGQSGYDYRLMRHFSDLQISYVAKSSNANTIAHFIPGKMLSVTTLCDRIGDEFPGADVDVRPVALVSAIGSNMKIPRFLERAARALANEGINILAVSQTMAQVNMQFIIERECFVNAQIALHKAFIEADENWGSGSDSCSPPQQGK